MRRRNLLAGAGSVAALPLLSTLSTSARAQSSGVSDSAIVLGQSAPFSGAAEQLGLQFHLGAQLFFEALNQKGGVNGRRIELKRLDDGYEPERCAANTRQFIADDVFALFGYIGTPTSLAALPLATAAKVPYFAPFTGAEVLRDPFNRYAIHVRASYFDETAAIVRQLTQVGIKRISVFYQNDAYGKAGLEGVTRALKAINLEPASVGTVERNTVDVSAAVQAIMAQKPEAIVQISAYKSCAAFVREARKAGFAGNFYNVSFVGTQALADELGKDGAGVVVSQVMPTPYSGSKPISREFQEAIVKGGNKVQANFSSMEGFLAARLFTEGLRRSGSRITRDGLISGLESSGTTSIGGYSVSLSPTNHVASRYAELSMLTGDGKVRR